MNWMRSDGVDWLCTDTGQICASLERPFFILGWLALVYCWSAGQPRRKLVRRWFLRRKSARAWLMSLDFGEKEAR